VHSSSSMIARSSAAKNGSGPNASPGSSIGKKPAA
jgi:hypothetical protein